MGPTERAVLQIFFFVLCSIKGLHAFPKNHPSLGILNELIGQDSKSPLIVVVDSNNQAKTLNDDELDQRQQGQSQGHSKAYSYHGDHDHYPPHQHDDNHVHSNSALFSNQEYEDALNDLLRTSQKMLDMQRSRKNRKGRNNRKRKNSKKDSCENPTEYLAEQCSKTVEDCDTC